MKPYRPGFRTLTLAVALLTSTAAFAGFQTGQLVAISDAGSFANGDLGYVHNSADRTQMIGCYSYSNAGVCFANNAAGVYRQCVTTDASMIATIRSLSGDAYLYFAWDASGHCSFIEVQNDSTGAPKSQ